MKISLPDTVTKFLILTYNYLFNRYVWISDRYLKINISRKHMTSISKLYLPTHNIYLLSNIANILSVAQGNTHHSFFFFPPMPHQIYLQLLQSGHFSSLHTVSSFPNSNHQFFSRCFSGTYHRPVPAQLSRTGSYNCLIKKCQHKCST